MVIGKENVRHYLFQQLKNLIYEIEKIERQYGIVRPKRIPLSEEKLALMYKKTSNLSYKSRNFYNISMTLRHSNYTSRDAVAFAINDYISMGVNGMAEREKVFQIRKGEPMLPNEFNQMLESAINELSGKESLLADEYFKSQRKKIINEIREGSISDELSIFLHSNMLIEKIAPIRKIDAIDLAINRSLG